MIPLAKLAKLSPRHRMRKAALVLTELQRALMKGDESPRDYAASLALFFARDEEAAPAIRAAAARCLEVSTPASSSPEGPGAFLRALDAFRHALLAAGGQAPADWDLIDPATGRPDPAARRVHGDLRIYLEDLRSPFNVGSIFRTAEAFGVQELILSPECADPGHRRARRSAMGALDLLPWYRSGLEALDDGGPSFALELGGRPIQEFPFPDKGIAVLGSEELGVSAEARSRCSLGTVSIPMSGAKASLNVAVAFGILMQAWTCAIEARKHSVF